MLSSKQEKLLRSLRQKKYRQREGLYIIEGKKLLEEALQSSVKIHSVYFVEGQEEELGIDCERFLLSQREMKKVSALKNPPGILSLIEFSNHQLKACDFSLVLDGIKDPGNMGTILRTAESFGVEQIVCSEDCVDHYNEKVVQSSMGSIFRMPVIYTDLEAYLNSLNAEILTVGAALGGENIYTADLKLPIALLMGSESHGLNQERLAQLNKVIKIPHSTQVESLNVAMATGIILAELRRRYPLK